MPKDKKQSPYRSSAEIFEVSQKDEGGVKLYTGEIIIPKQIPVSGVEGVYEEIRDRCYFHYDSFYAGQGIGYEYYEPAYKFGAELAASPQYGNMLWVDIKDAIEAQWQTSNPNSWEEHRVQIVHGWNLVQQMQLSKKNMAPA
jgi:hypothetical protein